MLKPSKVEMLRIQRERTHKLRPEQRAALQAGFRTAFWGVLAEQLNTSLEACRSELETAGDNNRICLLQGEIAALRVLLEWADATRKEGVAQELS